MKTRIWSVLLVLVMMLAMLTACNTPEKGEKGDKGDQGEKGETGATGADGKSAYEYAQDGGYTGTEAEFTAKLAEEAPTAITNEDIDSIFDAS